MLRSLFVCAVLTGVAFGQAHPPMRALPRPTDDPLPQTPCRFLDPLKGNDDNPGSLERPWKTLRVALERVQPGETVVLRGGVYAESVTVTGRGTAEKPIILRAYPGELPILDGGLAEFRTDPATAWEPVADGAKEEYRSRRAYPGLGEILSGHFADCMIPLHPYRHLGDLRCGNPYWTFTNKLNPDESMYCGPGLWYDRTTGHIHVRLVDPGLDLFEQPYRGPTDPRKLALLVGGGKPALRLEGACHVKIRDLVVRGTTAVTVLVQKCQDVDLDGLAIYGGSPALRVDSTQRLRLIRSTVRGLASPWTTRSTMKYRGNSPYLIVASPAEPPNRDWEIAWCELTDSHDGPYVGTVLGLDFHHNLVDNHNDDGIYLTAAGVGGDLRIHENHLGGCLHIFSFAGTYPVGKGVAIYRNLIDLRGPVRYHHPKKAGDPEFAPDGPDRPRRFASSGRVCGDHGSPTWEPIRFYHNTVITGEAPFRDGYAGGWDRATRGTMRRVFNNVIVQLNGNPGLHFGVPEDDFQADANVLWSPRTGPKVEGDYFAAFRRGKVFEASKKQYPPGWGAADRFLDPGLERLTEDWRQPLDVRPTPRSPLRDAGVPLPGEWPDPLRAADAGKPDIGALPVGAPMLRTGPAAAPPR